MKKTKNRGIKRLYRAIREPFEWLLIYCAEWIIPRLSMRSALALSRFIADTVFLFDPVGRAVSRANLRVVCPRLSSRRERILLHGAYRNMARVLIMIFWMGRDTKARISQWVSFAPGVLEQARESSPCITVSAHIGNWEILSQACVAAGIPMTSVAKQIGSDGMTARLTRIRASIGQEILPTEGALRGLIKALQRNRSIGLLVDQHTHIWQGGTWVHFFGIPSGISLAPAMLALKLKRPIIFAWSHPLKDGRYRIEPGNVFPPEGSAQDLTQAMASAFERVIRRHPSLWCLNYRRFRYIQQGFPHPEKYPFYARPEKIRHK